MELLPTYVEPVAKVTQCLTSPVDFHDLPRAYIHWPSMLASQRMNNSKHLEQQIRVSGRSSLPQILRRFDSSVLAGPQAELVWQASVTIEGIKFVIDCGFVKVSPVLLFLQRPSYYELDPDV